MSPIHAADPSPSCCCKSCTPANKPAATTWLFTGRALGRPLCARRLAEHLRALGIPLRLARTAAVRELVLDVPAPVVAHAFGFHHTTTHRQNAHAVGTWKRFITTRNLNAGPV